MASRLALLRRAVARDQFREFCINEETRVRRYAVKLMEQGATQSASDLVDVADQLKLLGEEGMRPT
jgi:DNA polymerase III gamma/tau subunit